MLSTYKYSGKVRWNIIKKIQVIVDKKKQRGKVQKFKIITSTFYLRKPTTAFILFPLRKSCSMLIICPFPRYHTPLVPCPRPSSTGCSSGWWRSVTRLWTPSRRDSTSSVYWISPGSKFSTWVSRKLMKKKKNMKSFRWKSLWVEGTHLNLEFKFIVVRNSYSSIDCLHK